MPWPWNKKAREEKAAKDPLLELFRQGRLDYQYFKQAYERDERWPGFHFDPFGKETFTVHDDPELNATLCSYSRQYAWDQACRLKFFQERFKQFLVYNEVAGARFLLKACEIIEKWHIPSFSAKLLHEWTNSGNSYWWEPKFAEAVRQMSQIAYLDADDDPEALVTELQTFHPSTLLMVFPQATAADIPLLRALKLDHLQPLWLFIKRFCRYNPGNTWMTREDMPNSPDASSGIADVAELGSILDDGGEKLLKKFKQFLKKTGISIPNTLQMLDAFLGLNRESILQKSAKRNQPALKAYGLLPLTGEDDCLERYLFIRQFARESKQFGPQRQASERAAAEVSLANLAQIAGYQDTTRLEWAMEGRTGLGADLPELSCSVGEYTASIDIAVDGAPIVAFRDGKPLKSVPAVLRTEQAYLRLKEVQSALRRQGKRFRETLEKAMVEEQSFTPAELRLLEQMPMAWPFLDKLVFLVDEATFALYDREQGRFGDITGQALPSFASARIAHSWHLYRADCLSDWQREIVRRRITQPFKQVFRELYLLTPAELETGVYSSRFAGHVLNSGVVARLFQARGWQIDPDEFADPRKLSPALRIDAYFSFPDAGHYLSEVESLTSDIIYFLSRGKELYQGMEADYRLPLQDIPPLLFSEAMRDADLIVSVAQRDGDALFSTETYQRRG